MKIKKTVALLLIIASFNLKGYSQIIFEKGYLINNSNEKIECLIKNNDWKNNPETFEYKLSESNEPVIADLKSAKEFGIYSISKYIRSTVKIDKSKENLDELSYDKEPTYVEEVLFLKVLVEGKSNLYYYVNGNLQRFYYNTDSTALEPLVYKKYLISENVVEENNQFKKQLWTNLKCPTIGINKVENLHYKKNSILNFFVEYNKCNNSNFTRYDGKVKKDLVNLTLRAHLNNSSAYIRNTAYTRNSTADFGSKSSLGFGIELEYIFPFNKNKWAIFVEPTYQNFKAEIITDDFYVATKKLISNINYSSIEVPIGIRHYLFLNKNSKLFINASYVFDFNLKSSIEIRRDDNTYYNSLLVSTLNNTSFGVGYKFKDKYSIETRYQTSRTLLSDYLFWDSSYTTAALIFGYTLF
jgi:hypothetical protein